jgi:hypothetical protein
MASFSSRHLIHGHTSCKTSYSEITSHISQKKLSSGTLDAPSGVCALNFEGEFENLPFSYIINTLTSGHVERRDCSPMRC